MIIIISVNLNKMKGNSSIEKVRKQSHKDSNSNLATNANTPDTATQGYKYEKKVPFKRSKISAKFDMIRKKSLKITSSNRSPFSQNNSISPVDYEGNALFKTISKNNHQNRIDDIEGKGEKNDNRKINYIHDFYYTHKISHESNDNNKDNLIKKKLDEKIGEIDNQNRNQNFNYMYSDSTKIANNSSYGKNNNDIINSYYNKLTFFNNDIEEKEKNNKKNVVSASKENIADKSYEDYSTNLEKKNQKSITFSQKIKLYEDEKKEKYIKNNYFGKTNFENYFQNVDFQNENFQDSESESDDSSYFTQNKSEKVTKSCKNTNAACDNSSFSSEQVSPIIITKKQNNYDTKIEKFNLNNSSRPNNLIQNIDEENNEDEDDITSSTSSMVYNDYYINPTQEKKNAIGLFKSKSTVLGLKQEDFTKYDFTIYEENKIEETAEDEIIFKEYENYSLDLQNIFPKKQSVKILTIKINFYIPEYIIKSEIKKSISSVSTNYKSQNSKNNMKKLITKSLMINCSDNDKIQEIMSKSIISINKELEKIGTNYSFKLKDTFYCMRTSKKSGLPDYDLPCK